MEKNKGITLIALVITIIVLLILAGVTIATLTGDNGLLQKATTAKQDNEDSKELELIKLSVSAAQVAGKGTITTENLNNELKSNLNSETDVVESSDYWYYKANKNYRIYKDGKIDEGKLLPDEYQQVEYIESTGKQYINTGLLAKDHIDIYLEILGNFSSTAKSKYIFGCSDGTSGSSTYHLLGTAYSSSDFVAQHGIGGSEKIIKSADTDKHTFCLDFLNNTFSLDSDLIIDLEYNGTIYINQNYFLFSINQGGKSQSPASFKMNSCKILENNQLIRYYIPCYSVTNVINSNGNSVSANTKGLYDLVEGKFYTNKNNSGVDFTPGPEV